MAADQNEQARKAQYNKEYYAARHDQIRGQQALYYAANSEQIKASVERWQTDNAERVKANRRRCYKTNPEKQKEATQRWALANPEKAREESGRWSRTHPGQWKEAIKRWFLEHPKRTQEIRSKHNAKHRSLGFIPINTAFSGCEGHHLDPDVVMYVPKVLHRSIPHNVWTGRNMAAINAIACAWFTESWT